MSGNLSSVQMSGVTQAMAGQPQGPSSRYRMSAREIMEQYQPLNNDRRMDTDALRSGPGSRPFETDEDLMERKLNEAHEFDLPNSILDQGVKKPIHLGTTPRMNLGDPSQPKKPEILEGHHRLATALAIDPDMMLRVRQFHPEGKHSDLDKARRWEGDNDYGGGLMEFENRQWDVKKGYRESLYGDYTKKGEGFIGRRRRRS